MREGPWLVWLQALLEHFSAQTSGPLGEALQALRGSDDNQRKGWGIALLAGQYDAVPAALVPFIGAALQAAGQLVAGAARARAQARRQPGPVPGLRLAGDGRGGAQPWQAQWPALLACSLCACEWHVVRVKCVYCESSKDLRYTSLDDDRHAPGKAPLRAECCPACESYLKQNYLENDAAAEPLADDPPAWRWTFAWTRRASIGWHRT